MKIFIFHLLIIQIISGSNIKYGDEQITAMLKEYFLSNKSSPLLLGHQFYTDNDENIFQIELKTETQNVNSALLFGFKAINDIANVAKRDFTHSICVIHFNKITLPVIAESNLKCSRGYFIHNNDNEAQWRKNCLSIQNY